VESVANDAESVASDAEGVASDAEGVASNVEGVASNVESVASDAEGVASNAESVASNAESVASNVESVASNAESVASDVESVASNAEGVASNVESVASDVESVASNAESVASNVESVASDVEGVASDVEGVASNVKSVASGVESVASGSDIGGINANKIAERIHLREWYETQPRGANPDLLNPEENEILQIWSEEGGIDVEVGVEVGVGGMETVTDSTTVLSTYGLTSCSALIVLSDWNGDFYGDRTLVHLLGSNITYGLKYGVDASGLISDLRNKIVGGGKVIWVGGADSESDMALAMAIAQSNNFGERPLYELINTLGISLEISGSSQVHVYPDGTFELGEIGDGRGVLTEKDIDNILAQIAQMGG
ncbi:methyl-accepting chemotaxis protein, partial [Pectobacterium brasiliense]|uniref:methyl-accepting chemotaxis protein n=1 Tax=Pectobacterium brasiliense TaxID=180957 RepID=UPI001969873E